MPPTLEVEGYSRTSICPEISHLPCKSGLFRCADPCYIIGRVSEVSPRLHLLIVGEPAYSNGRGHSGPLLVSKPWHFALRDITVRGHH